MKQIKFRVNDQTYKAIQEAVDSAPGATISSWCGMAVGSYLANWKPPAEYRQAKRVKAGLAVAGEKPPKPRSPEALQKEMDAYDNKPYEERLTDYVQQYLSYPAQFEIDARRYWQKPDSIDFSLKDINRKLDELGHPEHKVPEEGIPMP